MVPESNQFFSEISEGALNLNIYFDVYFIYNCSYNESISHSYMGHS